MASCNLIRGKKLLPWYGIGTERPDLPDKAILAVANVVNDEHTIGIAGRKRILAQQLQRAGGHGVGIPRRFGQEELQLLHSRRLHLDQRLGAG